jgi:hypothetical protein
MTSAQTTAKNYMMPVRATGIPDENRGSFSYEKGLVFLPDL